MLSLFVFKEWSQAKIRKGDDYFEWLSGVQWLHHFGRECSHFAAKSRRILSRACWKSGTVIQCTIFLSDWLVFLWLLYSCLFRLAVLRVERWLSCQSRRSHVPQSQPSIDWAHRNALRSWRDTSSDAVLTWCSTQRLRESSVWLNRVERLFVAIVAARVTPPLFPCSPQPVQVNNYF